MKNILLGILLLALCSQEVAGQHIKQARIKAPKEHYQDGVVLVKLKPEYRDYFAKSNNSFQRKENDFLTKLNFSGALSFSGQSKATSSLKRRSKAESQSTIDIDLYYQLNFNSNTNVDNAIQELYKSGIIEYAEPSFVYQTSVVPNDPLVSSQHYLGLINAYDAWDISKGSEEIIIAIVDSGMDLEHPDLKDKIYLNVKDPVDGVDNDNDGYVDNYYGYDFAGSDYENVVFDNNPSIQAANASHGTSVAGCAAAATNNGTGIAGVGYNCKLMPLKHTADNDTRADGGSGFIINPLLGVIYAANNGADIINASYGSSYYSQIAQDIFTYAAMDKGCLVVAAAGNNNSKTSFYPASYDNVLSVAATTATDKKASFSNFGPYVDISAPGTLIYTTNVLEAYDNVQGTSFSSPIVAGAAGLLMAQYPELSGIQIGELLRVTADESFNQNLSATHQGKMGKGRLDILRALTEQPQSIRLEKALIADEEGGVVQAGEKGFVIADFKNYLWPSSSGLQVSLSTENNFVEVLQANASLGIIPTLGTASNQLSPFKVSIAENLPENTMVEFLLEFKDGEYTDYQYFTILLNPTYLNINENLVATSIASNGRIGYQDTQQTQGIGFAFDDSNLLYEMGVIMGTSSNQLSNNVRSAPGIFDNDFLPVNKVNRVKPGTISSMEVFGSFNDELADEAKNNVLVNYRTYTYKEKPYDQFIIIEYTVENTSQEPLIDYYFGLYADWDIEGGANDQAAWDASQNLGYVYNNNDQKKYGGIQELIGKPNYYAIDNDQDIEGNTFGVYDGFTDEEKFSSISSGIGKETAGNLTEGGNDVSHTVASGPYQVNPGEKLTIAFALHGANTLDELTSSAASADSLYNLIFKAPRPVVDTLEVCYGEAATIVASEAESYKWYIEISGGESFNENYTYTIPEIFGDTILYVSNADLAYESIRVPAVVKVVADPTILMAGSSTICEGDSVILSVGEADEYLWSNGETSREIVVKEAGKYAVEVRNNSFGCISRSDTVSVTINSKPSADFEIKYPDGEIFNEGLAVELQSSLSNNVEAVFWDFGDGVTSTEINPVHIYEQRGDYLITLTVTTALGCQQEASRQLMVTKVEENDLSDQVILYPNPASDNLWIQLPDFYAGQVNTKLIDLSGKLILKSVERATQGGKFAMNLTGVNKGVYLVQVRTKDYVAFKRIVIE